MHAFIHFTLRQKVVFNLAFVLLIVIGAFALLRMPVERYPNIQFGKMYINTFLPGGSPEDVETLITREIEDALEDVEDVDFIRSTSYRERSNIVIKFADDSDYRKRFDDVRLKVLAIMDDLPDLPEPPVFNFLDVNDWFPTISVNIAGDFANHTLALVAEELRIPLSQIAGVKEVKLLGEFSREFHLTLDPARMRTYGLTYSAVVEALQAANAAMPAGHMDSEDGEFILQVDEQFRTRDDILAAILRTDSDGSFIRVADVARDASFGYRDPFLVASVNGTPCVTLQVLKNDLGNALFIAREVRETVAQLADGYRADGFKLSVTQDSSTKIEDSIRVLGTNLLLGVILVYLIIWRFMGLRNAGLTTIGIPFAFLVTMVLMYLTDNSVNEVSLFAFVLVSGIIVDDAIVVVENIFRHVQAGKEIREAIVDGTAEVFLPVVSATLTTAVAFLPMLIMTGMVGDFFAIVPKTIVFALAASLLECLLILPCHYLDFGPRQSPGNPVEPTLDRYLTGKDEGRFMVATRRLFNRLVALVLRWRLLTLLCLATAFLAAMAIFFLSFQGRSGLVRIQFFPDNYSLYYVEVTGPAGTPLATTDALVRDIAAAVMHEGQTMHESALGFSGYLINEDYSPQYGNNLGHVAVTLPDVRDRRLADYPKNDVIAHLGYMREKLQPLIPPGFTLSIRPEKDGPPAGKDLSIRVLGNDSTNVRKLAAEVERFLREEQHLAPWLLDLQDDQGSNGRLFRLDLEPERVAEWGLTMTQAARLASSVVNGGIAGEVKLPGELIDLKVRIAYDQEQGLLALLDTPIIDLPQGVIHLGDLGSPVFSLEPGQLNRYEGQRAITLTANLKSGAPLTSPMVVKEVRDHYLAIRDRYPGAALNFSGEHESTRKSFLSLTYAFGIALLLIYLILAAQFQSYLQPLIIISAVIFALIGVIYGTILARTLFTVNSFVAVVGVTGVVVNDSLVLVEFLNRCYRRGQSRREALLLATNIRLRPILLTTLTTTLGLLPMALGIPEYSLVWGSMAMTFVTGLCTATLLTIIVVPVQWDILSRLEDPTSRNWPGKAASPPPSTAPPRGN